MDQSGAILPTTVKGFQELNAGSLITVKGKIKREGKITYVIATEFYPG